MSVRYHRNFAHAKHTNPLWKHQFNPRTADDMIAWTDVKSDNGYDASDFSTTTVTVVEVLPHISTSTPSYSVTSATIPSASTVRTSLKPTTAVTIIGTKTSLSHVPTSSFASLTSSALPASFTSSPPTSSGIHLPQNSKTSSSLSSKPGAIAGLVIACIFIFLIGIFFAIRTWYKIKRASKLRKTWPHSGVAGIGYGTDALELLHEPKTPLGDGNPRALPLSVQIPSPHVSVPPISYNSDAVIQSHVSSSPSVFTSPLYSPGLTSLSPYSATIVCTFIPSLPDELTIFVGETLHVLSEFEDGWSLCMDCRGEQGMVPNECLDRSMGRPKSYGIARSSARVTSLAQVAKPGD